MLAVECVLDADRFARWNVSSLVPERSGARRVGGTAEGLAASSVVRSVDALEESLGTALFNRTTRQVTLSDAGTTYYTRAKKLLDDLADADASVSDRDGEPSGPLRVSVPVAFGSRLIAPHIASFLSAYPKIELDVRLSHSIVDLVAERIDVAIRLGEAASTADLVSKRLATFKRCVRTCSLSAVRERQRGFRSPTSGSRARRC